MGVSECSSDRELSVRTLHKHDAHWFGNLAQGLCGRQSPGLRVDAKHDNRIRVALRNRSIITVFDLKRLEKKVDAFNTFIDEASLARKMVSELCKKLSIAVKPRPPPLLSDGE